jgi:hypothetical protein
MKIEKMNYNDTGLLTIIVIDSPAQIKSAEMKSILQKVLITERTDRVTLKMDFVCPNWADVYKEFKILVNKIAFDLRERNLRQL